MSFFLDMNWSELSLFSYYYMIYKSYKSWVICCCCNSNCSWFCGSLLLFWGSHICKKIRNIMKGIQVTKTMIYIILVLYPKMSNQDWYYLKAVKLMKLKLRTFLPFLMKFTAKIFFLQNTISKHLIKLIYRDHYIY